MRLNNRLPFILMSLTLLGSCAQTGSREPKSLTDDLSEVRLDRSLEKSSGQQVESVAGGASLDDEDRQDQAESTRIPSLSSTQQAVSADREIQAPKPGVRTVNATVKDASLPDFIDTVFGEMLRVPYYTGEGVAGQSDVVVQMRSSGTYSAEGFLELVTDLLKEYGIAVVAEDGVYKILSDQTLRARMPRFIRARSTTDTPEPLRPVVLFRTLDAIAANEMATILKQAFEKDDQNNLSVEMNQRLNVIILSGLPDEVDAAVRIIDQMDDLDYAGTELIRYSPQYRVAGELADELTTLLAAEGWQASNNTSVSRTILVVPIDFTNDLFVFCKSPAALARVRFHLNSLDKPGLVGDVPQIFVYDVQNVDAEILANTVNRVLGQSLSSGQGSLVGRDQTPGAAAASGPQNSTQGDVGIKGAVVVDVTSNRLIFTGSASDYNRLKPLLQQLDTAASEVLIQVTVAEITLNDETRFGLEFFVDSIGNDDFDIRAENSGTGLGGNGLNVGVFTGNVELAINALASNNQVNVLSKPKLIARSGGAAQIQVGTDVPVITAQRASNAQDGDGLTDILQSVEYRKTGVLLSIEPIVFSQNRVDLTVSQEVSTALPTTNSNISSPTISSRTLDTQLSIQDGETVVLGGLMQTDLTEAETGVPLLKDIPVAGNLFRNKSVSQTRTELLVLITAYILRGKEDKQQLTDTLVSGLESASSNTGNLNTLVPRNRLRELPLDENNADRSSED